VISSLLQEEVNPVMSAAAGFKAALDQLGKKSTTGKS
jgi:hypothetical protein